MFRKIVLALRVYVASLLFVGVLLTGAFVFIVCVNAGAENLSLPGLVLGRMVVFVPVLYLFYEFKKREFIYYRNLGVPRLRLLIYLELIDTTMSIIILAACYAIIT